jgi:AcrR family transcriptional regulator
MLTLIEHCCSILSIAVQETSVNEISIAQTKICEAAMRLFAQKGTSEVSVSELAQAAGVARGTIYNNFPMPERLFEEIATRLANEMHERIAAQSNQFLDPALAVANGLRQFVRRAHDEPDWGRFILRFALSNDSLKGVWAGQPAIDLMRGLNEGRFSFQPHQAPSILAMIAGTGLTAMLLVLEGHKSWREAATSAAEFVLRALGVSESEAQALAGSGLAAK